MDLSKGLQKLLLIFEIFIEFCFSDRIFFIIECWFFIIEFCSFIY
jgi:hypothetical protein